MATITLEYNGALKSDADAQKKIHDTFWMAYRAREQKHGSSGSHDEQVTWLHESVAATQRAFPRWRTDWQARHLWP